MSLTNRPTAELQALDAAHHIHPFTDQADLAKKGARVIREAKGIWLTDTDGEPMLDGMAGLWCVNIGYGRHELAEAAARQMRELPYYNTFFQTSHVPVIDLAAKAGPIGAGRPQPHLLRLLRLRGERHQHPPCAAVLGAEGQTRKNRLHRAEKRLPRVLHGQRLARRHAGHARPGRPADRRYPPHRPAELVRRGRRDEPGRLRLMRARELEQAIEEIGEDRVAAFIGEPIQGAGGVIVPPSTYWPEIQRICDAHDILLIADEVICGFGRTGNWFGHETVGIRPDIITIAKGLSSGYQPIGGSVVSDEVADVLGQDDFAHGYTYSGHPVACAVAMENLRIMEEEGIVDHVRDTAAPHLKSLWTALADHPLVGEASISGMMASLALTPDKASRAAFAAGPGTAGPIGRDYAFANGLVMRHVYDRLVVSPPLIMTPSEIDTMIERVEKVLDLTVAKLKEDGLYEAQREN